MYHPDQYYRLVTAAFLHANLLHIAVNMISLVFVGPYLERSIGWWRFALVYLLVGAGRLGRDLRVRLRRCVPVVGASGALFGLLGTCLVLVRRLNLDMQWLVGIVVLNFALTFSVAGISRLGHIGGFVTGALCGAGDRRVAEPAPPDVRSACSWPGSAAVLVLIVLVVAVRTSTGSF